MIVSVESREMSEDIVVRTHALLSLHGVGAVVPGVVDHHPSVVEADAQHERVVQDPVHQALHLLLPVLDKLGSWITQVSPARESSIEIFVVDVVSSIKSVTIGIGGRKQVYVCTVYYSANSLVTVIVLCQVSNKQKYLLGSKNILRCTKSIRFIERILEASSVCQQQTSDQ